MKASIVRRFAALALATVMVVDCLPAAATVADAEVEGLQMPAWLIRAGKREPLAIGTQLRTGDLINTGTGSRALLRMGDGSTVKLGENAKFSLDSMAQERGRGQSAVYGIDRGRGRCVPVHHIVVLQVPGQARGRRAFRNRDRRRSGHRSMG